MAKDLKLEQMDMKTAFLPRDLHEDIYLSQPADCIAMREDHLVCRLKKRFYGLKHIWKLGYCRRNFHPCLYVKCGNDQSRIYLILYVDDMLIVGNDRAVIRELKERLHENVSMKELGNARHILGMQIEENRLWKTLQLSQQDYV